MSNISLDKLIKVGISMESPQKIAINYSKNEFIPDNFVVEYYSKFYNVCDAEVILRDKLKDYHYKKNFYKVSKESAINIIENIDLKKHETFVKNSKENIIKLENEFTIRKKRIAKLKKFYDELKKIKKSIENFPLKANSYLIYTTYHIEVNYQSLLGIYKEICIFDYETTKQKKEISLVYDKLVKCIELKNKLENKYVKIEE